MLRVLFFAHRFIQFNNCIKGALLAVAAMLAMTLSLTAAPLFTSVQVSDVGYSNSIGEANTSRNVAVAPNGDIYVVFSGSDGIRVAKSTNGGQTFAPSVQVSTLNGEAEIDIASNGTVYVAWLDWNNVYFSRSIDGGSTFSPALAVGSATSYYGVHIANYGPNVYLLERDTRILYYNNDYGSGPFNGTYVGYGAYSDVRVDPNTGFIYVMSDVPNLSLWESVDNGISFYQKPLSPGGYIYYSSYTLSSGPLGVYMFVSGSGWEAYKVDVLTGGTTYQNYGYNWNSQGRTLASDEYGNLVDGYNSGGDLRFHVSYDQGSSFQPEILVTWGYWDNSHNVAINPVTHDIVVVYEQYDQIFLSVYDHELKIPLDVATTGFSKVDCYSATVDGKVINDGAGRIVSRGVVYGTSPNPTIADKVVSTGAGEGAFTEALTNLCPGTTYYARAYGTNSWGETFYGDDIIITPTTFALTLDQTSLWPPNHKMSTINATVSSDVVCGYSYVLKSITSNEPDNGLGDGDKPNDIQNAGYGTNDLSFDLRAERSGKGTGRVYTATYVITDACNVEHTVIATVAVPHDMDKEGFAGDDIITNTIAVYPNPAEDNINVFLNFVYSANVSIILTDLMGNKVSSTEINSTNNIQKQIDIQNLAPGAYFVRIQFGEEHFVKTIIKN